VTVKRSIAFLHEAIKQTTHNSNNMKIRVFIYMFDPLKSHDSTGKADANLNAKGTYSNQFSMNVKIYNAVDK